MQPNKFPKKDLLYKEYLPKNWWIAAILQLILIAGLGILLWLGVINTLPMLLGGVAIGLLPIIFTFGRNVPLHIHVYPDKLFVTFHLTGGANKVWVSRELKFRNIRTSKVVDYKKEIFGAKGVHVLNGVECFVSSSGTGLFLDVAGAGQIFFSTDNPAEILKIVKQEN